MPIYEYRCSECRKVIEVLESSSRGGNHPCPACGKEGMERIFSAHGVGKAVSLPSGGGCGNGSCPSGGCPYA